MLRSLVAVCFGVAVGALGGPGASAPAYAHPAGTQARVSTPHLPQLLGFSGSAIVRIDPDSLKPLAGARVPVSSGGCSGRNGGTACWGLPPWSASPDGKRVAVANNDTSSVAVVDATRLRVLARIPIGGGQLGALTWLSRKRLLALQEMGGERQRLLVLDVAGRRVVARRPLGGSVLRLAVAGRRLVVLLSPAQRIGRARLAVASSTGAVRFLRLGQIVAGSKVLGTGSTFRVEAQLPGLAVDSRGNHAFVVGSTRIADVDLARLSVSYHTPSRQPAMAAKEIKGHERVARWLGRGLLAVSGTDATGEQRQPAGLRLIDTARWSVRTLDPDTGSFNLVGDVLLASGWKTPQDHSTGTGLAAYALDSSERFRVLEGRLTWLALAYRGRAYVGVSGQDPLTIVDLGTGDIVGSRTQPLPTLLLGEGAGWWQQPLSP